MDVTLVRPIAPERSSLSVWLAGLYASLVAARQAQADARIVQHLRDLGLQSRIQQPKIKRAGPRFTRSKDRYQATRSWGEHNPRQIFVGDASC
jgi:hypothetical protein